MIAPNPTLLSLDRSPEFSGLLKDDNQFARGDSDGIGESFNGWFDTLMIQSGIRTAPSLWLGLCLLCSLALGGVVLVATERPFVTVAAALIGLSVPMIGALIARSRRQKAIMEQLPGMADELSRCARSGRNLEHSFMLVAADTPSPLGDELRVSARRMEMGLDVGSAVRDLTTRTGVSTLTMFTSALTVHQDTGGDLISVLERLATAVRDRLHFVARQRAATIASRMGAILMVVIPVFVMSFYLFRDPNYFTSLTGSFWGRLSLWTAIVFQVVGCMLVFRILSRSARF
jgi:tight adherence protein B